MKELRRCPFCGNENLVVLEESTDSEIYENIINYAVCCDFHRGGCGATSGYRISEEEAIEAWNKRVGKLAINALEKADKYRWHDLRKNPDDLPEAIGDGYESEYVLVMIGTPEWNSWEQAYYHHGKRLWSTYEQNVFAWRYIEPFGENKDDE